MPTWVLDCRMSRVSMQVLVKFKDSTPNRYVMISNFLGFVYSIDIGGIGVTMRTALRTLRARLRGVAILAALGQLVADLLILALNLLDVIFDLSSERLCHDAMVSRSHELCPIETNSRLGRGRVRAIVSAKIFQQLAKFRALRQQRLQEALHNRFVLARNRDFQSAHPTETHTSIITSSPLSRTSCHPRLRSLLLRPSL